MHLIVPFLHHPQQFEIRYIAAIVTGCAYQRKCENMKRKKAQLNDDTSRDILEKGTK